MSFCYSGAVEGTRKERSDGIAIVGSPLGGRSRHTQPRAHGRANKNRPSILTRTTWQGRRDSNTQPTVLETATLPLSHSPVRIVLYTIKSLSSSFYSGIRAKNLTFSTQFCIVRFCAPLAAGVTLITISKAEKKVNDQKMNNKRKAAPTFPNTIRNGKRATQSLSRKFQQQR